MADNYLEKHYAEYEARKAAWERARKLGKKKLHGSAKPVKPMLDDDEKKPSEGE